MAKKIIAYTITLKNGTEFDVRDSANAWWMAEPKVHSLFVALELGCTVEEICHHVGITLPQYKYFARMHPELRQLRKTFEVYPKMRARNTLRKALDNPKYAMKYLENKLPGEFGNPETLDNVQNLLNSEWEKRKQEIKNIAEIRRTASGFKSIVPGLTDNDDPMPWDPKNHKKEFERVVEEVRKDIAGKIHAMRVASGYVTA